MLDQRLGAAVQHRPQPVPWTSASPTAAFRARSRRRSPSAASFRFRSVMSRKTSTLPEMSPRSLRIGAAESSIGRSVPSFEIRTVWLASPTILPLPQRPQRRVLDRLAGVLVDDAEHVFERPTGSLARLPADQLLGDRVQEVDPALGVGADDGIADARQRDLQPLPLLVRHLAGGGFFRQSPGVFLGLLAGGQVTSDLGKAEQLPPLVLAGP